MKIEDALAGFGALSQATRLEVFRSLLRAEPKGLLAGEIAKALGVPQSTLSTHLAILVRAGLAMSERHGRQISYRADIAATDRLVHFLIDECCTGKADGETRCRPQQGQATRICDAGAATTKGQS